MKGRVCHGIETEEREGKKENEGGEGWWRKEEREREGGRDGGEMGRVRGREGEGGRDEGMVRDRERKKVKYDMFVEMITSRLIKQGFRHW